MEIATKEHLKELGLVLITREELRLFAEDAAEKTRHRVEEEYRRNQGPEFYYTANQVCKFLNVTKQTLWRWGKSHYLEPIRIGGGLIRYKKSDIERITTVQK